MWFWISLMNPHRKVFGFAADLNYALIIAIVTLGSWLLLHPEESKAPPRDRMTFLIIAIMIWISVTSLNGGGPPDEIYTSWIDTEKMFLMTLVAYTMTNTRERFDQLLLVCVLSLAYHGLSGGVFTILTGGQFRVQGPYGTMIGDNNDLGVALTMVLPLVFYLQYRYTQPYLKWPLRGLIGFTVIGTLFTYSRGAVLALVAMSSVLWIRSRHKIAIGMVAVVAVVGLLAFAPAQWFGRVQTIQSYEEDESAQSRLWLWRMSWAMALKHPITGGGFRWSWNVNWANQELRGSGVTPPLTRPRAPHSIWFEMLGYHGFVGLALFIGVIVVGVTDARWLIRQTRDRPDLEWANHFGRMLQASIAGYVVGGSFVNLSMYDGFYAVVLLGSAARRIVAAELATQDRALKPAFSGTFSAPSAVHARLTQPVARM